MSKSSTCCSDLYGVHKRHFKPSQVKIDKHEGTWTNSRNDLSATVYCEILFVPNNIRLSFGSFMLCMHSKLAATRNWHCRSTSMSASCSSQTWWATRTGGWLSPTDRKDTSPPTTWAGCLMLKHIRRREKCELKRRTTKKKTSTKNTRTLKPLYRSLFTADSQCETSEETQHTTQCDEHFFVLQCCNWFYEVILQLKYFLSLLADKKKLYEKL